MIYIQLCSVSGPGSSVGIATELQAGRSGDRIPVGGGAIFSAPVQIGPGAHPAACTMGTGSFPGVKSGRGLTVTPHPLLVPWSRRGRAMSLLPVWAVGGTRWCSWLRHCATSRKGAGSISDGVIGIFHWHNISGRTMALGLTQPLREMSTRNISWG